jgi:hypothetical protein
MDRFGKLVTLGVTAVAMAVACSSTSTQSVPPSDGTQEVGSSQASALITGTLEASVHGEVRLLVNEGPRVVTVAADRSFVVREVPSGNVKLAVEVADVGITLSGTVVIEAVQPGEVIQITIRREGDALVIVIVARNGSSQTPRQVTQPDGAPLVISGNDVLVLFPPMVIHRDILVTGNHVSLVGLGSCNGSDHTVLLGALTIRGDDAIVFDIDLRGPVTISGNRARVQNTCGGTCFADGCIPGGNTGGGCMTATSCQGATNPPGTTPPPPPPPLPPPAPPPSDGGTDGSPDGGRDGGAADAGADGAEGL